jgi:hypothetical protein
MSEITASNVRAFSKAAIACAQILKASADENEQAVGELLAHSTGVIIQRIAGNTNSVNPLKLDEIFKVGDTHISYRKWVPAAETEIRTICLAI